MKQLLLGESKRTKGPTLLFAFAFIIIFLLLPLTLLSLFEVRNQAETDVTHYARGSYDLLIRPSESILPLEVEKGLVPENYIGFGAGGISLAQWEEIKKHAEIEIAAPVASLGYYTGMKNTYAYDPPEQSTRYTSQLFTSDGFNQYPISKEYVCTLLEYEGPHEIILKYESVVNAEEILNWCLEAANFELPPTYHLVVAIDRDEEGRTGISFPEIHGAVTATGWASMYNSEFGFYTEVVPIMELMGAGVSIEAAGILERVRFNLNTISEIFERNMKLMIL